MEVIEHGEENALFAFEVQVERTAGDARSGDDVRDPRPTVPFPGEDPDGSVEQLVSPDIRWKEGWALAYFI
jgi:hypothetical protein